LHFTLHLTNNCNMSCGYCYVDRANIRNMTMGTANKAVDLAAGLTAKGDSAGIIFFGGEPLLHKDVIYETVEYAKWKEDKTGCHFHYKATTNGLLLDDDFLEYSLKNNLFIALSHDGIKEAHDKYRRDALGEGTFERLSFIAKKLLNARPYAPVLMTVNPDSVKYYSESVKYLYDLGFRYIICSLNYAADWSDEGIRELEKQYRLLEDFYYGLTVAEEKFYFSPFEVKISSHINKKNYCHERCELGKKQLSISPDGLLYPCVQFVGDERYSIGSVNTGIDEERRETLYRRNEKEKDTCGNCAVRARCNHYCGCLNKQATGSIDCVSPVLCAHERVIIPIADKLAARLYKKKNAMFIQKHYNEFYPIVSMVEDESGKR
jgi:uncharacterized protein